MKEKTAFLGTQNINKLLLRMSAPAMVGMLVMALYNVVDTIFIGRAIGTLGIAGVTISLPLQIVFFALSLTVGIGTASEISRRIGAGQKEAAERFLGVATWLVLVGSALIVLFGLLFLKPILIASGSDMEVLPFAMDYMRVLLYGAPFLIATVVGNNLARAEGNAPLAMKVMIAGALVNGCLDYVFLFPLHMGISGAAWATSISNVVSFLWLAPYFLNKKSAVPLLWKYVRWHTESVRKIMVIGAASFMQEVSFVLETLVLNHILMAIGGSVAVAAMGILMRLSMMVLMPIFGVVQGLQPIAGYNFGAKKFDRVRSVFWSATQWGTIIAFFSFVVLYFFPEFWVRVFVSSEETELISVTVEGLKYMVLGFAVVGFQSVTGGLYQALGFGKQSMILSLLRQVIFLIPAVLILSHFFGVMGVWLSFPIADVSAVLITGIMLWHDRNRLGIGGINKN
jgi:putative MATE family efflux protein